MTIFEKVKIAENNKILILHKEGIFYKLYNRHAMYISQNIKPLKVQCKWFKNINQQVYIVGFPIGVFELLKDKFELLKIRIEHSEDNSTVKLLLPKYIDETQYSHWVSKHERVVSAHINVSSVIAQLLSFQLSNHTPIEAMSFLSGLQKEARSLNL